MEWIVCDNCGDCERKHEAIKSGWDWTAVVGLEPNMVALHFCKPECLKEYSDLMNQAMPIAMAEPQRVIDRFGEANRTAGRVK